LAADYNILVVEDEESLANTLALNLRLEGMDVMVAGNGPDAFMVFKNHAKNIDLVLLDVMLPGISGFDLFPELKKIKPSVPVIFLTARGQTPDKISGLKLGANDYIVKPFDLEELLLRVKNTLKQHSPSPSSILKFNNCSVNFDTYEISDIHGDTFTLSKREIGLLKLLTSKANKVISRDEIIEALWEPDENASSRTIDNYILNFRKYFEKNPKKPEHFLSIRSVGYKFVE
jgi:two-component system alkaline phosphatase synthesis response regulator PhoP